MEEGCHCAFHGMSWMSRDMDGRLVGHDDYAESHGNGWRIHQQWQEATRMDELPRTDERRLGPSCCKRLGVVGPYRSNRIHAIRLCRSFYASVLSPTTLPGNWGTSMATEYGITSFALAGDVGRRTSVWFVDTARQKSRSRSTKVDTDRDKRDTRNTVKRITKFGWSQVRIQPVCNATVVPLTTQYFPQILHTVQIYKALVYSTRHFQHKWSSLS